MAHIERNVMLGDWEGCRPPPQHYEYRIALATDGRGEVAMSPDFSRDASPVWAETFALGESVTGLLFRMCEGGETTPVFMAPVRSGKTAACKLTVSAVKHSLSPRPVAVDKRFEALHVALRAAVPAAVWSRLESRLTDHILDRR
jgi:hypothetical protein